MCQSSAKRVTIKAGIKNLQSLNRPMTSKVDVERRATRAEELLDWMKENTWTSRRSRVVLWSDENMLVADRMVNTRNRRVLWPSLSTKIKKNLCRRNNRTTDAESDRNPENYYRANIACIVQYKGESLVALS